ncbi:MAG: BBP7 family outer membrane beta-barrel protein [Gemmataceae bacterium]
MGMGKKPSLLASCCLVLFAAVGQAVGPPAPIDAPEFVAPAEALCEASPPSCPVAAVPGTLIEVQAEYLLWWTKGPSVPPLLTTSDPDALGMLDAPSTRILSGGKHANLSTLSGFRWSTFLLLTHNVGVDFGGFLLQPQSVRSSFHSDANGTPLLALPYIDPNGTFENAAVLASPATQTGSFTSRLSSLLWGGEVNGVYRLPLRGHWTVNLTTGFRYLNLHDELNVDSALTLTTTPGLFAGRDVPVGSTIAAFDAFDTRNEFYGGQVGCQVEWYHGPFSINARGKVALGDTVQSLTIAGSSVLNPGSPNAPSVPGGFYALPSNTGRISRNVFSVVPEVGVNVGCLMTRNIGLSLGYNFLYWSNVIRASEQVDRHINVTQVPSFDTGIRNGANMPTAAYRSTDFWAHGVNISLLVQY